MTPANADLALNSPRAPVRARAAAACALMALALVGCRAPETDLEQLIREVRAQRPVAVEPLEVGIAPLPPLAPPARDPFLRRERVVTDANAAVSAACDDSHLPTESYTNLRYAAPMTSAGRAGAVLAVADGRLYHLLVGERFASACAELRSVDKARAVIEVRGRLLELPNTGLPGQ
ncbi:MAG: hypothetical protein AAF458_02125 [Pseudomonadota bacterium]